MPAHTPPLIAIVGPTCTGKTRLAVALAAPLQPAELINADSRQLRRGLAVGTCAPTTADLDGIRCHVLEQADPGADYTVADWLAAAKTALADIEHRGARPIIVGGTGLYVTALINGYDLAHTPPDPETRAARTRLAETPSGRAQLAAEITRRDPDAAAGLDTRNPRRLVRALEILDAHGRVTGARGSAPRPAVQIGLDVPASIHEQWVANRTTRMFHSGAITDEVARALQAGVTRDALLGSGIGYGEALSVLDGTLRSDDAIALTVRRTLRYAKAQRSYLRRERSIRWIDASHGMPTILSRALMCIAAEETAPALH